ncbi:muscular LMNA-interacting protein isoform X4 [Cynoglossus semilaevis]|uniref:muscular LMNA-interacting protein isoform X4 n=1 Tax=Cynoglossus semilaevis TaxID=244447 RepID=UPI000D62AB59|nr:muscular LMNA-interacting protein isoform X4 [Cynoglossus semilaevis]
MNSFNQTPDMISAAVPSGFHGFTFVPVLQKLPLKTLISEEWTPGVITRRDDESAVTSHETISEETMSEIFKAEMVFIKDSSATEGRGEGGNVLPSDKQLKMKPSTNYASLSGASSSGRTENTSNHITAGRASMETAVDQHRGISQWQCQDTLGRAETHKIKLSYKSLAAIPTNTLLLDQQAIDEQVERTDSPGDTMDRVDTHAEMCSPAQLRQESEELYATIDEILANSSAAPSKSSSTNIDLQADRVSPAKMRVFMSPKSARQDTGSERRSPFSPCELRITESGNQNSHSVKAAPALAARAEERRAASETHI